MKIVLKYLIFLESTIQLSSHNLLLFEFFTMKIRFVKSQFHEEHFQSMTIVVQTKGISEHLKQRKLFCVWKDFFRSEWFLLANKREGDEPLEKQPKSPNTMSFTKFDWIIHFEWNGVKNALNGFFPRVEFTLLKNFSSLITRHLFFFFASRTKEKHFSFGSAFVKEFEFVRTKEVVAHYPNVDIYYPHLNKRQSVHLPSSTVLSVSRPFTFWVMPVSIRCDANVKVFYEFGVMSTFAAHLFPAYQFTLLVEKKLVHSKKLPTTIARVIYSLINSKYLQCAYSTSRPAILPRSP